MALPGSAARSIGVSRISSTALRLGPALIMQGTAREGANPFRKSRRRRPGRRRRRCPDRPAAGSRRSGAGSGRPRGRRGGGRLVLDGLAVAPGIKPWPVLRPSWPRDSRSARQRGGSWPPASSSPAARAMSRPTVSASSSGPIGMPKATRAASIAAGATPRPRCAWLAYVGRQYRVDQKAGRALDRQGELVDLADEGAGARQHRPPCRRRAPLPPAASWPRD